MNKNRTSYKDEALLFLARGDWKKALESIRKHCDQDPQDLRSRLKKGELLERLGKKKEAIEEYRQIAEAYAREGFLLQAISVNKIILRIDPSSKDINERLAQLYKEKTRESKPYQPLPYIPLLSDLNEEELRSLLDRVKFRTDPKGTLLCQEGAFGDSLFVICKGEVGVYKQHHPEGKEVLIRYLGEGDCFGEFSFFLDQKRHATVMSLADCELLEISRNELEGLIKKYPRVREVLEELFKKRVLDLLLALSPLFAPLSAQQREEVSNRFHLVNLPGETYIFKGGDPSHCLYMIKSGEVEIFTQDRRKRRVVLEKLGGGHLFGEIGVLLNTPRMAFARTTLPSELLELPKKDFDDLLGRFPHIQSIVREISSMRLGRTKEILSRLLAERVKEPMV